MELKKTNEKLSNQLKKADDTDRVKQLEEKLDKALVQYDTLEEEHSFITKQFETINNE